MLPQLQRAGQRIGPGICFLKLASRTTDDKPLGPSSRTSVATHQCTVCVTSSPAASRACWDSIRKEVTCTRCRPVEFGEVDDYTLAFGPSSVDFKSVRGEQRPQADIGPGEPASGGNVCAEEAE
jgi:hypothetical protein